VAFGSLSDCLSNVRYYSDHDLKNVEDTFSTSLAFLVGGGAGKALEVLLFSLLAFCLVRRLLLTFFAAALIVLGIIQVFILMKKSWVRSTTWKIFAAILGFGATVLLAISFFTFLNITSAFK